MKTYIGLFRGINMGGHNLLPMQELVKLLEKIGFRNVKPYIQSGNIVFQSAGRKAARIADAISAEIKKGRGVAPHILVLTPGELEKAIAANPFPEAETDPKSLHVLFLLAAPKHPEMQKLEKARTGNERFRLVDRFFYLHAPDGVGRSKLAANAERLLGVPVTGRNWRTVAAVMAMANDNRAGANQAQAGRPERAEQEVTARLKRPRYLMPDFIKDALQRRNLTRVYRDRPPYQRNDYIGWITRAKMKTTQEKRLGQMLDELDRGDVYMNMTYRPKRRKREER